VVRNPVPWFVFFAGFVAVALMWRYFAIEHSDEYAAVRKVARSHSDIKLGMQIHHTDGPISDEYYQMEDVDGVSTSEYRAVGRNGTTVKVDALPRQTFDVAFLFDRAVADGIWELADRPIRGDATTRYTVDIYQLTNGKHGSHHFSFTDPHYWATTGGHQFHIHLDKNKPVPDLLRMSSTVTVEPRYERLVGDFLTFGTAQFKEKIAQAQAKIRTSETAHSS
jgi:hypothetical protein